MLAGIVFCFFRGKATDDFFCPPAGFAEDFLLFKAFAERAAAKRSCGVWGDSLNKQAGICMLAALLATG